MWGAHLLTISRIPLALLFWAVADDRDWALAVLGVAALTDALDGRVARWARRRGAHGRWADAGAWLDPLCDKFLAISVLTAIAVVMRVPLVYLALIGARELVLVPLVVAHRLGALRSRLRVDYQAAPIGKAATVAQFVAIAAVIADHPWYPVAAAIAGGFGLIAVWRYLGRGAVGSTPAHLAA
jgi:phosphatidylglycerophosphate synthase